MTLSGWRFRNARVLPESDRCFQGNRQVYGWSWSDVSRRCSINAYLYWAIKFILCLSIRLIQRLVRRCFALLPLLFISPLLCGNFVNSAVLHVVSPIYQILFTSIYKENESLSGYQRSSTNRLIVQLTRLVTSDPGWNQPILLGRPSLSIEESPA